MEAAFGADFWRVRIHVGPEPASIGAAAFAWGENVYFSPEAFALDCRNGHRLLRHELAHVLQQRSGRARNPLGAGVAILDDPALECEAERLAGGRPCGGRREGEPAAGAGAGSVVQCVRYHTLCTVGTHYVDEEGKESPHRTAKNFRDAESTLKNLLAQYSSLLQGIGRDETGRKLQSSGRAMRHLRRVVTGKQTLYRQNKREAQRKLEVIRDEVTRQIAALNKQGIVVSADGSINWQLSRSVVRYDHELERQGMTRIIGIRGKLCWAADTGIAGARANTPASTVNMTTFFSGPGYGIYVMSAEGNIHLNSHSVGKFHHSSLLAGGDVAGAGEMQIAHDGTLLWISNKSGHYRPSTQNLGQVIHRLTKMGIPRTYQVHEMKSDRLIPVEAFEVGWDFFRLQQMSVSFFHPAIAEKLNWAYRPDPPHPGFYDLATGRPIDHKVARKGLKRIGIRPNRDFLHQDGQFKWSRELAAPPVVLPSVITWISPDEYSTPIVQKGEYSTPIVQNGEYSTRIPPR